LCALELLAATGLRAGTGAAAPAADALRQMSDNFERLAKKVSPAVVKILVTGYGPVAQSGRREAASIGRQHSIGSGAIVDSNGYVITNAHVVEGAQRVRVVLTSVPGDQKPTPPAAKARILNAKVAGVDRDTDLAVLKVEATGLPTLPMGDYRKLRQGQLVLAFGSPEGLEDSVTMGVVSSVMRQPDPDQPMIYIQTDAAVNPGNSGGPLVDMDGNLAGINTFILSESGGNEGLGFAIPSVIVGFVYQEIRSHGHVHRPQIGADVQAISPALAAGLELPQDWGLIVSDVLPDGPAGTAGLKVQDIVLALDGTPVEGLPAFAAALYRKAHGDPVTLEVLRGSQKLTLKVPVVEEPQHEFDDLEGLVNPETNLVHGIGILGIEINRKIAEMLPDLRMNAGVLVVAKAAGAAVETGLRAGDLIHSVNGVAIVSLGDLRAALNRVKPGDAVAMQLEREGKLMYLAFELE
jgi:serine protease Do